MPLVAKRPHPRHTQISLAQSCTSWFGRSEDGGDYPLVCVTVVSQVQQLPEECASACQSWYSQSCNALLKRSCFLPFTHVPLGHSEVRSPKCPTTCLVGTSCIPWSSGVPRGGDNALNWYLVHGWEDWNDSLSTRFWCGGQTKGDAFTVTSVAEQMGCCVLQ